MRLRTAVVVLVLSFGGVVPAANAGIVSWLVRESAHAAEHAAEREAVVAAESGAAQAAAKTATAGAENAHKVSAAPEINGFKSETKILSPSAEAKAASVEINGVKQENKVGVQPGGAGGEDAVAENSAEKPAGWLENLGSLGVGLVMLCVFNAILSGIGRELRGLVFRRGG